jgi:hypothetical protein
MIAGRGTAPPAERQLTFHSSPTTGTTLTRKAVFFRSYRRADDSRYPSPFTRSAASTDAFSYQPAFFVIEINTVQIDVNIKRICA